ncbi:MAG TPA: type II toxin-antitoxin system RelE/ParE family toxin [Puia sp.]
MEKKFEVEFLPDAVRFLEKLDRKSREKIYFNIRKAQITNDPELFKKLTTTIWEFRTLYNHACYRLFAFWDKTDGRNTIVIATHGIVKKTGKTPKNDIEMAEHLRQRYFNQKN